MIFSDIVKIVTGQRAAGFGEDAFGRAKEKR